MRHERGDEIRKRLDEGIGRPGEGAIYWKLMNIHGRRRNPDFHEVLSRGS
jgi:hypothetical protein